MGLLNTKKPVLRSQSDYFNNTYKVHDGDVPQEVESLRSSLAIDSQIISYDEMISVAPKPGEIGRTLRREQRYMVELLPSNNSPINRMIRRMTDQTGGTRIFLTDGHGLSNGSVGAYLPSENVIFLSRESIKDGLGDSTTFYHELRHAFFKARAQEGRLSPYNSGITTARNKTISHTDKLDGYHHNLSTEESHNYLEDARRSYRRIRNKIRNGEKIDKELISELENNSSNGSMITSSLINNFKDLKGHIDIDTLKLLDDSNQIEITYNSQVYRLPATDEIQTLITQQKSHHTKNLIETEINKIINQLERDQSFQAIFSDMARTHNDFEFYFNIYDGAFTPGSKSALTESPFFRSVRQKYPDASDEQIMESFSMGLSMAERSEIKNANGSTSLNLKYPPSFDEFDDELLEDDIPFTLTISDKGVVERISID